MASDRSETTSPVPNALGSSQQKSHPERKGKKDSTPTAVGSGDSGSGAPRSRSMPTGIWGPDGKKSTWTPRKKSTFPAGGRQSTSPAGGRQSTSPAGGRQSTSAAGGRQSTFPAGGRQSTSSAGGRQSMSPAGGRQSTSAAGGRQSTFPAGGRQSTSSAGGRQSTSPAGGRQSTYPAGGRQSTSPAGGRQSTSPAGGRPNTKSSRPAASRGTRGAVHHATPAPFKSPSQSTEPPPKPEEVPLCMDVKIDPKIVKAVEQQTRGQRRNPAWYAWRKNRITASIAHNISHSHFVNGRDESPPISYLKAITGEKRGVKTPAMIWGNENEAEAVQQYKQLKRELLGWPVKVEERGLYIDPEHPWLAASPDGIVMDTMTGELLGLEIKCPYKHRNRTVAEACAGDKHFCLELRPDPQKGESPYQLKTNHCYYTQVQCQMAVLGHLKVDFVVYTKCGIAIVPVNFDREFWDSTLPKLEIFYKKAVLPYLQSKGEGGPLLQREE